MKLLVDQNLSPRLVPELQGTHPGSAHVREFSLEAASDLEVWEFAKQKGFVGNCTTDQALAALRRHRDRLAIFWEDEAAAFLVLS